MVSLPYSEKPRSSLSEETSIVAVRAGLSTVMDLRTVLLVGTIRNFPRGD